MKGYAPPVYVIVGFMLVFGCREKTESSKPMEIVASLDTTVTTIGDVLHFKVAVANAGNKPLRFSPWESSDSIEVRRATPFQSAQGDSSGIIFDIVFWDTGHFEIPAYEVAVLKVDSSLDYTLKSDPIPLQVMSLVEQSGVSELRPVKSPVPIHIPWPWRTIGRYLLLVLLLGGILFVWRHRQKREYGEPEIQPYKAPPDEVARDKLNALRNSDILTQGEIKQFYVTLSYLLREYVENSFFIKTLEMTTEQINTIKNAFPFDSDLMAEWLDLLQRADFTKYARGTVPLEVCQRDLEWAENFIIRSAPIWKQFEPESATDSTVSSSKGI